MSDQVIGFVLIVFVVFIFFKFLRKRRRPSASAEDHNSKEVLKCYPPDRLPEPRYTAKSSSWMQWLLVFGGSTLSIWATLQGLPLLATVALALAGAIMMWMHGFVPHRAKELNQAFTVAVISYVVLAFAAVYSVAVDGIWRVVWSALAALFSLWLFRKSLRHVPTKHYAVHTRQRELTGTLLPKGGPYGTLAFFDGMGETGDPDPEANNGPISEELRLFEVMIPVEIDGRIPGEVPFFIQLHADSQIWNNDGENVFYMLKLSDLESDLLDAFAPYVRGVAAAATSYRQFNKRGVGVGLWLQFILKTGVEPHLDEKLCAKAKITEASRKKSLKDNASAAKFYQDNQNKLKELLSKMDGEYSDIEWALGIRVGGAGAGIRDVVPPKELADAMLANEVAKQHAEAAKPYEKLSQRSVDNVFIGQGNKRVKRVIIASEGEKIGDFSRGATLYKELGEDD
jgi:hypothetical protein